MEVSRSDRRASRIEAVAHATTRDLPWRIAAAPRCFSPPPCLRSLSRPHASHAQRARRACAVSPSLPLFDGCVSLGVGGRRPARYSDFVWLHGQLELEVPGAIVPPLPEKAVVGRFTPEFIEARASLSHSVTRE